MDNSRNLKLNPKPIEVWNLRMQWRMNVQNGRMWWIYGRNRCRIIGWIYEMKLGWREDECVGGGWTAQAAAAVEWGRGVRRRDGEQQQQRAGGDAHRLSLRRYFVSAASCSSHSVLWRFSHSDSPSSRSEPTRRLCAPVLYSNWCVFHSTCDTRITPPPLPGSS